MLKKVGPKVVFVMALCREIRYSLNILLWALQCFAWKHIQILLSNTRYKHFIDFQEYSQKLWAYFLKISLP